MALAGAVFCSAVTLSAQNSPAPNSSAQNSASTSGAATQRATLDRFCIACHRGNTPAAGLHLDTFDLANFETNGATWEKLARKLRNREMPPADMRRPDEATYKSLVEYIETGRDRLAELKPNPGRPTLHRLNRTEYGNAIRDLLALEMDVTELLPADDIGYGFDNIGDVLQVSPVLLERYLSTARKISRTAVGDTTIPVSYQTYEVPHRLIQDDRLDEAAPVGSRGGTDRAPSVPGGRRVRDFGHPGTEQRRRIPGPLAGTQARSQARRSKAPTVHRLRPIRKRSCSAREPLRMRI
jgi:hypothetical protein